MGGQRRRCFGDESFWFLATRRGRRRASKLHLEPSAPPSSRCWPSANGSSGSGAGGQAEPGGDVEEGEPAVPFETVRARLGWLLERLTLEW